MTAGRNDRPPPPSGGRPADDGAAPADLDAGSTARACTDGVALSHVLLDTMSDGFAAFDDEWRYTYVNRKAELLLGRSSAELLGRVVWEVFPEARTGPASDSAVTAKTERRLVTYEFFLPPVGRWIQASNYPIPNGIAALFRDVSAERERAHDRERLLAAERAARADAEAAREQLTTILESIGDAFYAVDADFRFTYVNWKAEELWGRKREELLGRQFWAEFPIAVGSESYRMHCAAMASRKPVHYETSSPVLKRWVDVSIHPDSTGGLSCYFRTIEERKRAEAERDRLLAAERAARREAECAREAAVAANRAKSDFLAVMSHELRTPLNAIGGYAELLEMGVRGPVNALQREDLDRIQKSQRHLLGLINEVLSYARLETGAVTYDLTEVRVADALAAAEILVAPQLRAKGLAYTSSDCGALVVRADPDKLQQVLLNLLSNAIKFTQSGEGREGRIAVTCEVADGLDGTREGRRVLLRLRDTGVGIPDDKLEAIFEPFVQVDARLSRRHQGAGLGLAISRDLARGMGGDLYAQSTPGVGSEFTLALPCASSRASSTRVLDASSSCGSDDSENRAV